MRDIESKGMQGTAAYNRAKYWLGEEYGGEYFKQNKVPSKFYGIDDMIDNIEASAEFLRSQTSTAAGESKRRKNIIDALESSDYDFFGDIELSKQTRQAAYDAVSKPVFKDPETGEYLTAIQKLEHDNGEEFMAKLGLIYALTDGFSNIDKLVGKKVKKEVKKGFANLESVLQNTSRDSKGNLKFVSNDSESFASGKIKYPDFKTL